MIPIYTTNIGDYAVALHPRAGAAFISILTGRAAPAVAFLSAASE